MFDDDRYEHVATESEAHAEWHRNSGVPMGTPGCPQDACHGNDYEEDEELIILLAPITEAQFARLVEGDDLPW